MATVFFGGIETPVLEIAHGLQAINALAHALFFEDGTKLEPNPAIAALVKATMVEGFYDQVGDTVFVVSTPQTFPATLATLQSFHTENPEIRVISSVLSVSAYREALLGVVISPITTPATSRLPNDQKRIYRTRWSV